LTSSISKNLQQFSGGSIFQIATQLLDANKNGSILDDVIGMLGKFRKK